MEDVDAAKKNCKNFEKLSNEDKKLILEQQYKKQRFWCGYSVLGQEYNHKYDTGEIMEK